MSKRERQRLIDRAVGYITSDRAIPVDLAVRLGDIGIDVCALESAVASGVIEQTEINFDEET